MANTLAVDTVSALRTFDTSAGKNIAVFGYYASGDSGGGLYFFDPADTTSADNGGTVIVGSTGARLKLAEVDRVTARQFGAKGDGVTNDAARIQAADTALPTGVRFTSGTYRISTNLTISKVALFEPGAVLSIDAGVTVTFSKAVDADPSYPIFSGSGTVAGLKAATLNWFGAVGDDVADDTVAINKAIAAGTRVLHAVDGCNYRHSGTILIDRNSLDLQLGKSSFTHSSSSASTNAWVIGNGLTQLYSISVVGGIFTRQIAANGGATFFLNNTGLVTFEGIRIYGNSTVYNGIRIVQALITTLNECHIEHTNGHNVDVVGNGSYAARTIDFIVHGGRYEYADGDAIRIGDYVEGVFIDDAILFAPTGSCFSASASSDAAKISVVKIGNTDFDSGAYGAYINRANNITLDGVWASNNTVAGLRVDNCEKLNISGGQIYPQAGAQGITLGEGATSCADITISGGLIIGGGLHGIYSRASCTSINIGPVCISSVSGWAIHNYEGPNNMILNGVSGRGNANGISSGGSNVKIGLNLI